MRYHAEKLDWPAQRALFLEMRPPHSPAVIAAAREALILANVPLANRVAVRFRPATGGHTMPREDVEAEALLALVRCVDGFDPSCGIRFSTYYWDSARLSLTRAVAVQGASAVQMSPSAYEELVRYRKHERRLSASGRPHGPGDVVASVRSEFPNLGPVREGRMLAVVGLYGRRREPYADLLIPRLPGRDDSPHDDTRRSVDDRDELDSVLRFVAPEDRQALALTHGLGGGDPLSLAQSARVMGVSRERVRQRVQRAITVMRAAAV